MSLSSPPTGASGIARRRSLRAIWLLGALFTLIVVSLSVFRPQLTEFIELKLVDLKFRYRGAVPAGQEMVIVAIDDDSLKSLGRWPWSREVFAKLMQRLKEAEPKVIGLDIIFAEKSDSIVTTSMERIRQRLSQRGWDPGKSWPACRRSRSPPIGPPAGGGDQRGQAHRPGVLF